MHLYADVLELADKMDLESIAAKRAGSNPVISTITLQNGYFRYAVLFLSAK